VLSSIILLILCVCWYVWTGGENIIPLIVTGVGIFLSVGIFLIMTLTVKENPTAGIVNCELKEHRISGALMITFGIFLVLITGVLCFKGFSSDSFTPDYAVQEPEPNYIVKTSSSLNVRSGPGNNYDVIGKLTNGQKVSVSNIENDWASIYYNGSTAYVSSKYLEPLATGNEIYQEELVASAADNSNDITPEENTETNINIETEEAKNIPDPVQRTEPVKEKNTEKKVVDPKPEKQTPVTPPTPTTPKGPGYVTESYPNGNKYAGMVNASGEKHGQGTYSWANGDRYKGNWINGQATGKGTYYSREGWRFEGEFLNLKFNGNGVYYFPDGKSRKGVWKNGQLTK
jgi:uncharacterized protein YraI